MGQPGWSGLWIWGKKINGRGTGCVDNKVSGGGKGGDGLSYGGGHVLLVAGVVSVVG